MPRCFILFLCCIFLSSCGQDKVFDQYKPIANAQWHKDSIVRFVVNPVDTIAKNNLYLQLRNTNDYAFSNIFLIVGIDFPDKTRVVDTLEYEMADAQGKFLGTGLTDLKENKLEYKTNVVFPQTGAYNIEIQHAMRKSGIVDGLLYLDGITDVGLSIEKAKE